MNPLERIEKQLESLIEGSLARLMGTELTASTVAAQVVRAMQEAIKTDEEGTAYAPDQYALTLRSEQVQILLEAAPTVQTDLAQGLLQVARSNRYVMAREPHILLAADETLAEGELRVVVWHSSDPLEMTQGFAAEPEPAGPALPRGAFLIVDGSRHFPLDRPVLNIGRRLDNQLILDDPRVSRTHAQLRVREGHYVLFDLGSTSGTLVNGRPIRQHTLRPGDVITIAGLRLVYGEDPGGLESTSTYTPPFPLRPAGDQPTYTIDREDGELG